mmetsp:Transcript_13279/g.28179  ORF Transcript_13279/g.28179 Transcript_13279/m.28179 type:complete len:301 (+) Transcript_13279:1429-2331(+)
MKRLPRTLEAKEVSTLAKRRTSVGSPATSTGARAPPARTATSIATPTTTSTTTRRRRTTGRPTRGRRRINVLPQQLRPEQHVENGLLSSGVCRRPRPRVCCIGGRIGIVVGSVAGCIGTAGGTSPRRAERRGVTPHRELEIGRGPRGNEPIGVSSIGPAPRNVGEALPPRRAAGRSSRRTDWTGGEARSRRRRWSTEEGPGWGVGRGWSATGRFEERCSRRCCRSGGAVNAAPRVAPRRCRRVRADGRRTERGHVLPATRRSRCRRTGSANYARRAHQSIVGLIVLLRKTGGVLRIQTRS